MQITNSSDETRFISAIGKNLGPGESAEVDDAVATLYANNPFITVQSGTTTPAPTPTPAKATANVAPVLPTEDTEVSETSS